MSDSLALVIPVHNDQVNLTRLLRQAAELHIFDQVVIADDGSQTPVHTENSGLPPEQVVLLRSTTAQGPGAARNKALQAVTTSYLLFFDSDDQLTRELPPLWQALQGTEFDFCLFRHHDSRMSGRGLWGQMPLDNALWRQAKAPGTTLYRPSATAQAALAQTANYPWNKLYRTDFLRDHPHIRCSTDRLHEDIPLHWLSFLHATVLLASDRVAAIHEVHANGTRMTNQRGAERLCVFQPLTTVAKALAAAPQTPLRPAFFQFTANLLDWVRTVMAPDHHGALDLASGQFLRQHVDPALFDRITKTDPILALRLCLQMAGGTAPPNGDLPC